MDEKVKDYLAVIVIGTFCILTCTGQIASSAFVAFGMYIGKKYYDEKKKEG